MGRTTQYYYSHSPEEDPWSKGGWFGYKKGNIHRRPFAKPRIRLQRWGYYGPMGCRLYSRCGRFDLVRGRFWNWRLSTRRKADRRDVLNDPPWAWTDE